MASFIVHDGEELFKKKIRRSQITISILKIEDRIHELHAEIGKIHREIIKRKIAVINELITIEMAQFFAPTLERNMEAIRLTEDINSHITPEEQKQIDQFEHEIATIDVERRDLLTEFGHIDKSISEFSLVQVIKGTVKIPDVTSDT